MPGQISGGHAAASQRDEHPSDDDDAGVDGIENHMAVVFQKSRLGVAWYNTTHDEVRWWSCRWRERSTKVISYHAVMPPCGSRAHASYQQTP